MRASILLSIDILSRCTNIFLTCCQNKVKCSRQLKKRVKLFAERNYSRPFALFFSARFAHKNIGRKYMIKRLVLLVSALFVLALTAGAQTPTPTTTTNTAATADTAAKKPPVFRPTKDQISQVQKILKEKKFYDGDATGAYNDPTREGIKTFQKGNGLKETGTLNRATLEKFGVALTDAQKAIPVSQGSYASGPKDTSTDKPAKTSDTSGNAAKRPAPFRANSDQIKAAQK